MTNDFLVRELINEGALKSANIIKAFEVVDRADFVLPEDQTLAYENHPLPIGFGQTISQPYTVAFMLELLEPKAGEKILDVGCGSGWQTALLAYLVGKGGRIFAIERIFELAEMCKINLFKYPMLQRTSTVIHKNGSDGLLEHAPFDKIIAAASGSEIPEAWKQQLKVGGRIVAPVNESIVVVDKTGRNEFKTTMHHGFVFVPLVKD